MALGKYNLARFITLPASSIGGLSAQYFVGPELHVESVVYIQLVYMAVFFNRHEIKLNILASFTLILYFMTCFAIQYEYLPHAINTLSHEVIIVYNFVSAVGILYVVTVTLLQQSSVFVQKNTEVAKLNGELKSNLNLKSTLNKMIVHDMSSPIMIIDRMAKKLESKLTEPPSELKYIRRSNDSIKNMIRNVKALMLDLNNVDHTIEKVSIFDLVKEIQFLTKTQLENKKITLKVTCEIPDYKVTTNKSLLLNNILINIISNSIKFSPSGDVIELIISQVSNHIEFKVLDTGPGMSDAKLATIFSFDTNISTAGTENEQGTGYGLPIVKFSADLVGAKLFVKNRTCNKTGLEFSSQIPFS